MKTNSFFIFLFAISLFACNPDDDDIDCIPFIDEGTVSPSFAIGQLPAAYWDSNSDLLFMNANQDSMIFTAQNKISFPQDKVVKINCENGDSTAHIYKINSVSRNFTSDDYTLFLSAGMSFASSNVITENGAFISEKHNCLTQTLNSGIRGQDFTVSTSMFQRFNPDACPGNSNIETLNSYTVEDNIELNGQQFTNVFVTKDEIFGSPAAFKLYYNNEIGFIGFEDNDGVLWVIVQ